MNSQNTLYSIPSEGGGSVKSTHNFQYLKRRRCQIVPLKFVVSGDFLFFDQRNKCATNVKHVFQEMFESFKLIAVAGVGNRLLNTYMGLIITREYHS